MKIFNKIEGLITGLKIAGISLLCLCFALIPETIMYFVYQIIDPTTVLEKILIFGIFWFGGVSVCVLFAVLGLMLWAALVENL